jgi:hypothetical protein
MRSTKLGGDPLVFYFRLCWLVRDGGRGQTDLIDGSRSAAGVADRSVVPVRRRDWRAVLLVVMLLCQTHAGAAAPSAGPGAAGSVAGLVTWATARQAAAERRLGEAIAAAAVRAAALAVAEAELTAADTLNAGLLAARRDLEIVRGRTEAERRVTQAASLRLERSATAGVAALALRAHRSRVAGRRERSTLLRAAVGGAVEPWARHLGQCGS